MASLPDWGLPYLRGIYGPAREARSTFQKHAEAVSAGRTLAVQGFSLSACPGSNRHGQRAGVIPVVAAGYWRGTYGHARDT